MGRPGFIGYLIFVVLLYAADLWILGLDLNAMIASLGIISIALALASQQIISNLLAGLLITIDRTIRLDDWVDFGGDPATGIVRVRDLTFTRTILEDRDGRVFSVPNAALLSSKIVNYSKSGYIEIPVDISLPFRSLSGRPGILFLQSSPNSRISSRMSHLLRHWLLPGFAPRISFGDMQGKGQNRNS